MALPSRRAVPTGAVLLGTTAMVAVTLRLEVLIDRAGRADLFALDVEAVPILITVASASAVGAVLTTRRAHHPVGWLFLALGFAMAASGAVTGYAVLGAVARPGSLPAARVVGVVADLSFISWFALVTWVLHLTPTGSPLAGRWRAAAVCSSVAMALWAATGIVWPGPLDPPLDSIRSPLAVGDEVTPAMSALRTGLGVVSALGLVVAAASLVVRFRRARGDERRRLLWLAAVVVPLPVFVGLAFYSSPDHPVLLAVAVGGITSTIPIAAGLSIVRYHLYDIEQILSRAVAWLLATAVLALTFALVVGAVGRVVGDRAGGSSVPAVLATLVAGAVALPAYRGFQEALDRRFSRRRFDAVRRVQDFVRDVDQKTPVTHVLRRALGDPTLDVAYWVDERESWLHEDGRSATSASGFVEVQRRSRPVARVWYDSSLVDAGLAQAVCDEAAPALESAMLRTQIGLQLTEVTASRARIAAAQMEERRRLERDLHDGAQQRLLAVAIELRAAQLNGSADRLSRTVDSAITELQVAVSELRDLATGLHPAVLQRHGLAGAVEDLASRFPIEVDVDLDGRRFPDKTEATAWFIACEGVANAVKHAAASTIGIRVTADDDRLVLRVSDDGSGGADPAGRGLRGLADRTEALGGTLSVSSGAGGTTITGVLPCGS